MHPNTTESDTSSDTPAADTTVSPSDVPSDPDQRQWWPVPYAVVGGSVVGFIGAAFNGAPGLIEDGLLAVLLWPGTPLVYITLMTLLLLGPWALHQIGRRNGPRPLRDSRLHGMLIWVLFTPLVGLVAWLLGPVVGPLLMSTEGVTWVHVIGLLGGTIGLPLFAGLGWRKTVWFIFLPLFALSVMLGVTFGERVRADEQEREQRVRNEQLLDDTCAGDDAWLFPDECS